MNIYELDEEHCLPFENHRASKNCLAANPTINSGAMTATSINWNLRHETAS
jgi:hypothetical protein